MARFAHEEVAQESPHSQQLRALVDRIESLDKRADAYLSSLENLANRQFGSRLEPVSNKDKVTEPTNQAGLLVTGARAVAPNTVGVTFMNVTTVTMITPTASESLASLHHAKERLLDLCR